MCLFPESSLGLVVTRPAALKALEVAARSGRRLLAISQRDPLSARDLHAVGTLAEVSADEAIPEGGRRVELDGLRRARTVTLVGMDLLLAEVELLEEGHSGDEWGAAVEALARYLHTHAD